MAHDTDSANNATVTVALATTAPANSNTRPTPMSRLNTSGAEIVSLPRQFGAGQTAIVLPNQHSDVLHFALDIGGSLIKMVYFSRQLQPSYSMPPTTSSSSTASAAVAAVEARRITGSSSSNSGGGGASCPPSTDLPSPVPVSDTDPPTASASAPHTSAPTRPTATSVRGAAAARGGAGGGGSGGAGAAAGRAGGGLSGGAAGALRGLPARLPGSLSGGRLHFVKFETAKIEECIEFIKSKRLHSVPLLGADAEEESLWGYGESRPQSTCIKATGGGAFKFAEEFQSKLGVQLEKEDEMACLVAGCNFLLRTMRDEAFTHFEGQKRFVEVRQRDVFPYLLVNIGSGVSIIKVDGPHEYQRVSGTSLGGGTFWGLGRLLTGCTSFDEILELSQEGDNASVDMRVGDIYGGLDYSKIGLSRSTIASSFGRVVGEDKELADYKKEDMALSLLRMVSYNIGQIAYLNALRYNLRRIFFGGFFIRGHAYTMDTISFAIHYWSKGDMEALFLRHEGYLGALGAFLSHEDHSLTAGLTAATPSQLVERFPAAPPPTATEGGGGEGQTGADMRSRLGAKQQSQASWVEKLSPLYDSNKAGATAASAPVTASATATGPLTGSGIGSDSGSTALPVAKVEGGGAGPAEIHKICADKGGEGNGEAIPSRDEHPAEVAAKTSTVVVTGEAAGAPAAAGTAVAVSVAVAGQPCVPAGATTGLGGFERPRDQGVLRSDDPALHVGVLHVEPYLQPFPLLAHPWKYEPNSIDLLDNDERDYWFTILEDHLPNLVEKAVASEGGTEEARRNGEAFESAFRYHISRLRQEPAAYGSLGFGAVLEMREDCLREFHFLDAYKAVKQRENDVSISVLPDLLAELDGMEEEERLLALIGGALAANIFDWGSRECVKLYTSGTILDIYRMSRSRMKRPWRVDDFDLFKEHWFSSRAPAAAAVLTPPSLPAALSPPPPSLTASSLASDSSGPQPPPHPPLSSSASVSPSPPPSPPYHKALLFVDNAGADVVLGMLPLARELLRVGTHVVLVANSLPAINDITADELQVVVMQAAEHCPILKAAAVLGNIYSNGAANMRFTPPPSQLPATTPATPPPAAASGATASSSHTSGLAVTNAGTSATTAPGSSSSSSSSSKPDAPDSSVPAAHSSSSSSSYVSSKGGSCFDPLHAAADIDSSSSSSALEDDPFHRTAAWPPVLSSSASLDACSSLPLLPPSLSVVPSGSGSPCLDFRRVSSALAEACVGADLIVLEGMGRSLHTNFNTEFTSDCLKLAMIKNERLARRLVGGSMYDCVCRFQRACRPAHMGSELGSGGRTPINSRHSSMQDLKGLDMLS